MNGRIYDPLLGQFMQPDNFIQTPEDYLGYDRYTYCRGNPFKYVDPSGEDPNADLSWVRVNNSTAMHLEEDHWLWVGGSYSSDPYSVLRMTLTAAMSDFSSENGWIKSLCEQEDSKMYFGGGFDLLLGFGYGGGSGGGSSSGDGSLLLNKNYSTQYSADFNTVTRTEESYVRIEYNHNANYYTNSYMQNDYYEYYSYSETTTSIDYSGNQTYLMPTQEIPDWIDKTNTGIGANTVNTVATVVPYISDIASNTLTSTKTGANIAYNYIAYNKYLLSGVKYLKPISYGASGVGIVSDVILTVEGQQSAVETGVNTGVTIGSMIVGGWLGIGLQADYQAAKWYMKTINKHPEWVMPAGFRH